MRSRFGGLRWRLLAAFLSVAVGAVALLALVAAVSVDQRTTALVAEQRAQLRDEVAAALAAAYTAGQGSWQPDAVAGVQALAAAQGAQLQVLDHHGQEVVTEMGHGAEHGPSSLTGSAPATPTGHDDQQSPAHGPSEPAHPTGSAPVSHDQMGAPGHDGGQVDGLAAAVTADVLAAGPQVYAAPSSGGDQVTVPILVNGTEVGTARLTVPVGAQALVSSARASLLRSVGIGAGLAVLLAAVVAALVSRRLSRLITALTVATRSFAAGEPVPDPLLRPAPGELGELGRAFTAMAGTVRRQDELRRAVVADVAHELRTPVTILRGQTEQLLDGIAEPTEARLVSLHDEVLRLERLTEDLATLSAADAAGLALHTAPTDLAAMAEQAVEAMRAGFDDADLQVQVQVQVEGTGQVDVMADPTRITQVITNLLTNAAKFTPSGGNVTVTVRHDGHEGVLTVADTGPGIPADELPHLFERFWRGRAAGGRSGTGIGLAVVAALVTAHGGTVTAESPAGGGARFTVRLPSAAAAASPGLPTRRPDAADDRPTAGVAS